MSKVGDFVGDTVGGMTGAKQQGEAAAKAGEIQAQAAGEGITETQRQFDKFVELMEPYILAGEGSLSAQQNLIGLGGEAEQAAAIEQLKTSPLYESLLKSGEEAILQNAAATGGLRGGNVQGALATYRPEILSNLVNQQYSRLGGITQLGQAGAAGQAAAGMQTGANIANLLGQAGAARAGGAIGQGNVVRQAYGDFQQFEDKEFNRGMQGAQIAGSFF